MNTSKEVFWTILKDRRKIEDAYLFTSTEIQKRERIGSGDWEDVDLPAFNWPHVDYRIKPRKIDWTKIPSGVAVIDPEGQDVIFVGYLPDIETYVTKYAQGDCSAELRSSVTLHADVKVQENWYE